MILVAVAIEIAREGGAPPDSSGIQGKDLRSDDRPGSYQQRPDAGNKETFAPGSGLAKQYPCTSSQSRIQRVVKYSTDSTPSVNHRLPCFSRRPYEDKYHSRGSLRA